MLRKKLSQALASYELHGDEVHALELFDRVHVHDVRVVESGDGLRLALEAGPALERRHLRRKDFQSHFAVELRVLREIDLAHAALSELLDDPVVRELSADHLVTSSSRPPLSVCIYL